MRTTKKPSLLLSLIISALLTAPTLTFAEPPADTSTAEYQLSQLLTPEQFDADKAIEVLEASNMSSRNKISGKAMIDSARSTPQHQLDIALEQIRVVLGLE
jgi:hypothetical protein